MALSSSKASSLACDSGTLHRSIVYIVHRPTYVIYVVRGPWMEFMCTDMSHSSVQ